MEFLFFKLLIPQSISNLESVSRSEAQEARFRIYAETIIEVRDSPKAVYVVPVCDGPEFLPDWESCWDAVAVAVIWQEPWGVTPRNQISRSGNPSLRSVFDVLVKA